ncbi:hypothetical protein BH10PSE17_BH10PSE17_02740 [soil metagenome]
MTERFEDAHWPAAMDIVKRNGGDPERYRFDVLVRAPSGDARKVRVQADGTNQKRDYLTANRPNFLRDFEDHVMKGVWRRGGRG